jgi:hypothetical protein
MSSETRNDSSGASPENANPNHASPDPASRTQPGSSAVAPGALRLQAPLPGMAAIALYLLLLAGTIVLGVVAGGHYPHVYLVFSALFITACAGLLMQFRWAWALALAAVALLAAYNFWIFSKGHSAPGLVQGALNLVFFLYLIRPEVRSRLR